MTLKRGSRGWRLIAVTVVVVPWFLRDHLATLLEQRSQLAQQVLIEDRADQHRQRQAEDQQEVIVGLVDVDMRLRKLDPEVDRAEREREEAARYGDLIRRDGEALRGQAERFEELLRRVKMDPDKAARLRAMAAPALKVGKYLEEHGLTPPERTEALLHEFDKSGEDLGKAFEVLREAAEEVKDSTATAATWARRAAWLFTVLFALMIGDWERMLPEPEGRGYEKRSDEPEK